MTLVLVAQDLTAPAFWDETKVYFRPLFELWADFWGYVATPPTLYDRPLGLHLFYLPLLWLAGPGMLPIRLLNVAFFVAGCGLLYAAAPGPRRPAALASWALVLATPITRTQLALLTLAPLIGLMPHWGRNLWLTGEFFHHITIQSGHLVWTRALPERFHALGGALLASYRLWPLILLSSVALILLRGRMKLQAFEISCVLIVLGFMVAFSGHKLGIPRYYLGAIPFLFYLLALPLVELITKPRRQLVALIVFILASQAAGDPTRNPPGLLSHRSGLHDGTERPAIRRQHKQVMAAVKAAVDDDDEIVTSWPFFEMLRSPYLGYGPTRGRIRLASVGNAPPKAILWTNFPKQIPEVLLHEWLSSASYVAHDFSYLRNRVILYLRKDP